MNPLSKFFFAADTFVELALLVILLRGPFRKYVLFSSYVLLESLVDVAEGVASYGHALSKQAYRSLYWIDHVTLYLLLFLVLITLTYQALQDNPMRPKFAKVLAVIAAAAILLPFALLPFHHSALHGSFTMQWFNHTSQILNFAAGIMNLVLWAALLSNRRRNPVLVPISIGFGLLTASAAIGWGTRQWVGQNNRWPIDDFMMASHLSALVIWCWAFRSKLPKTPSKSAPPTAAPPDAVATLS